jgi:magnesium transporter
MTPDYRLALAFLESHPREAARALERLPHDERIAVLRAVPAGVVAPALREMVRSTAADCLTRLEFAEAASIVAALMPDESADLLRRTPPDARDRILAALPAASRERVARVLRYHEGTAGAFMDPSIVELPDDLSIGEAQERVRSATRGLLYYLYVVDRARRLVGVLDIPELMAAPPDDALRAVMHQKVDRLSAWAPSHVIREHPGWRSYHAMPVVDEHDCLLGAIRYQTLRRLEQDTPTNVTPPATVTALALGELFHIGVTGLVGSLVSAASTERAAGRPEVQRG